MAFTLNNILIMFSVFLSVYGILSLLYLSYELSGTRDSFSINYSRIKP